MNTPETITLTTDQLADLQFKLFDKMLDMFRFANRPGYARITRDEMVKILNSRTTFERAVKEGYLRIYKDDNAGQFSEVWAVNADFKRFLKAHLPEVYEKYYSIKL